MKTKNFTVTVDENKLELMVKSPSINDQREAQKVYNHAFTDAIKSKCVVRAKMDDLLEEQGLWSTEKQGEYNQLQEDLLACERQLAKGGISLKKARQLALDMRKYRENIRSLISVKTSLDNHSAEGQADNARFNYLVSVCLVYSHNNQPYYKNMEEYLNRSNEEVAVLGAQHLASMLFGLDNDYETNLPENKFLKKYKFIDDKLRLVNKEGKLVDIEGRLIDENSRFIDEEGNFVDKFGNRVDADGDYIVEAEPFLDDDGNPVLLDEGVKTESAEASNTIEETSVEENITQSSTAEELAVQPTA